MCFESASAAFTVFSENQDRVQSAEGARRETITRGGSSVEKLLPHSRGGKIRIRRR